MNRSTVVFEELDTRAMPPVAPRWLVQLVVIGYAFAASIIAFNLGG